MSEYIFGEEREKWKEILSDEELFCKIRLCSKGFFQNGKERWGQNCKGSKKVAKCIKDRVYKEFMCD